MKNTQVKLDPHAIQISRKRAGKSIDSRTIRRRAITILDALDRKGAELSILLCDDTTIQELNSNYRNIDRPTNVLSFPMNEGDEPNPTPNLLGDVVISIETAHRQAAELNHSHLAEVTSLLIHGILHLLGHDHVNKKDEKKMFAESTRLEGLFKMPNH